MRTPTSTPALRLKAYAKINLGLRVLAKRPDGYHEIDTVLQTVDLYDVLALELRPNGELSLETSPDLGIPAEENLAFQAASLVHERLGVPQGVHIRLEKRIPVGAGLGGGSSDAAAVLRGLSALLSLEVESEALRELALELGSDVPFFLVGGRCRARGRGERLQRVPVPERERGCDYVLIVPPFSLSAREVYEAWDRGRPATPASPYPNDLEGAALRLRPQLAIYREYLGKTGLPFGMSGSGPTYFAVVPPEEAARLVGDAERALPEGTQVLLCRRTSVGAEILA